MNRFTTQVDHNMGRISVSEENADPSRSISSLVLTFVLLSPTVFEPRNTHGELTVIDFQTRQTDSTPNTRDTRDTCNTRDNHSNDKPFARPRTFDTSNVRDSFYGSIDDTFDDSCDPIAVTDSPNRSPGSLRELSLHVPTITNSPHCAPARTTHSGQLAKPTVARRGRTLRVDAWAVPVSANWSRTRSTARNAARGTRSAGWALPF